MITDNQEYLAELRTWSKKYQDWKSFKDSSIMVAGATGMIGSCLIDAFEQGSRFELPDCCFGQEQREGAEPLWQLLG